MRRVLSNVTIVAALAVAAPAQAQFAKPEDAYKYRASVMTLQGAHASRINGQLRSASPNLQTIAADAAVLDMLDKLFFTAFPEGSDMVANTRAKPEIWKEQAKFQEYKDRLNAEVAKLLAASRGGDLAATRTAFQSVGGVCKSCHDDFRRD